MALSAPALLADRHQLADFDSGEESLDTWLKKRALPNQFAGASRTFVACDGLRVAGFYALNSGAVTARNVPGRFRRNMPEPIPVVLLGRMAVDKRWQGAGLGRSLFRDAVMRVAQAAETIGIRGILVHALTEKARSFYLRVGFTECPHDRMTLVVTLQDVQTALAEPRVEPGNV